MKDLGVLVDGELKFHQNAAFVVAKTNCLLTIINKAFVHLDTVMLPLLYKSLVRPSIGVCQRCLGSFFSTDQVIYVRKGTKTCHSHGLKFKEFTL